MKIKIDCLGGLIFEDDLDEVMDCLGGLIFEDDLDEVMDYESYMEFNTCNVCGSHTDDILSYDYNDITNNTLAFLFILNYFYEKDESLKYNVNKIQPLIDEAINTDIIKPKIIKGLNSTKRWGKFIKELDTSFDDYLEYAVFNNIDMKFKIPPISFKVYDKENEILIDKTRRDDIGIINKYMAIMLLDISNKFKNQYLYYKYRLDLHMIYHINIDDMKCALSNIISQKELILELLK